MNLNEYQAEIVVHLDGQPMFGGKAWATYSGADLTAASNKTRTGGMGAETDNGGLATRSDATLTIQWTDDVLAAFKATEARVGQGAILISANWLDGSGVAIPGGVIGNSGVLNGITKPNYDANGTAVGMCQITVGMNEKGN
jgi:hypothetical protein